MIHPSYTELIEAINTNSEEESSEAVLNSRYSLVLATSKRARQLIAGDKALVANAEGKKPLSIAIEELYRGRVKILPPHARENLEEDGLIEESASAGQETAAEKDILEEGVLPEAVSAQEDEVFDDSTDEDASMEPGPDEFFLDPEDAPEE